MRYRRLLAVLAAAGSVASLALAGVGEAYPRPGQTIMLSVSPEGDAGTRPNPFNYTTEFSGTSFSRDGRFVAFSTGLSNLVRNHVNPRTDVFRRNMRTGRIELVPVTPNGVPGAGICVNPNSPEFPLGLGSSHPSTSRTGRYVAFDGCAANLVPGDTNQTRDVFVRDFATGRVERVSVSTQGRQTDLTEQSFAPAISDDGRYVVFTSESDDLVPGDANGVSDVFVRDRRKNTTKRVSISNTEIEANGGSGSASIDATGRYVVFFSGAFNLVEMDLNADEDVFVRDLVKGRTELISVASDESQASHPFNHVAPLTSQSISAGGRYVAFQARSPLVPQKKITAPFPAFDVFVRDRVRGRTTRVSVTSSGEEARDASFSSASAISDDGRFVAFDSDARNFFPGDDESIAGIRGDDDVFVHDTRTGVTELISIDLNGQDSQLRNDFAQSLNASLNGDGRYVAFYSANANLARNARVTPTSDNWQVYARDRVRELGVRALGTAGRPTAAGAVVLCETAACTDGRLFTSANDPAGELGAIEHDQGADLVRATVVSRPSLNDLFVRVEVDYFPSLAGMSPYATVLYGFELKANEIQHQVRVSDPRVGTDRVGPAFSLFRKDDGGWVKVADVRGGYGTTGHEVVFSLPVAELGLDGGARVEPISAFTAYGSLHLGPIRVLDHIPL